MRNLFFIFKLSFFVNHFETCKRIFCWICFLGFFIYDYFHAQEVGFPRLLHLLYFSSSFSRYFFFTYLFIDDIVILFIIIIILTYNFVELAGHSPSVKFNIVWVRFFWKLIINVQLLIRQSISWDFGGLVGNAQVYVVKEEHWVINVRNGPFTFSTLNFSKIIFFKLDLPVLDCWLPGNFVIDVFVLIRQALIALITNVITVLIF